MPGVIAPKSRRNQHVQRQVDEFPLLIAEKAPPDLVAGNDPLRFVDDEYSIRQDFHCGDVSAP
jgi:hypothetical protein